MRLNGEVKATIERWYEACGTGRIVGMVGAKSIMTSCVVQIDAEARRVLTRSGSVYELGEPDPDQGPISSITVRP